MMFRNLIVYSLPSGWDIASAALEETLSAHPLLACNSLSMQSHGWIPASPEGAMVYAQGRSMLLSLGFERRLLPASVIKQAAAEKAVLIERSQGFPVGRKQMRDLKEQVIEELRPRAFVRRSSLSAWIQPEDRWLCVNTGSFKQAEELTSVLRSDLGSLPIACLSVSKPAGATMAGWLMRQELPFGFAFGSHAELCGISSDRPKVSYVRHELVGQDLRQHLFDGKGVQRLHLIWRDRIEFVVTDSLQLKSVRYLNLSENPGAGDTPADTAADLADTDFALMTGELRAFLQDLITAFDARHPE